jgi:riboflavin kinase/FMN adenylyltransferase
LSSVVAVGVFDGLHLGHDAILSCALDAAHELGTGAVVVTFDPHPDIVLARSFRAVLPLTPIPEKRERLRARGVHHLEVIPFTRELAGLAPEVFVKDQLVTPFGLERLVGGEDFALGRGRAGDVARLVEIGADLGYGVDAVPLFQLDGEVVSSTRIRGLLTAGRVAEAARLLGRRYDLEGRVVAGEAIGRTLGYPTANLRLLEEKFLPADGVYAGWARIGGETLARPAAVSLGTRPTFDGVAHAIEAYLLDWDGDLSGREVSLELVDWIRAQERFDGPESLRTAMARDVEQVRRRLTMDRPGVPTASP